MNEFQDLELEKNVLSGLLELEIIPQIIDSLDVELFTYRETRFLFNVISKHFVRYKALITEEILDRYLAKSNVTPENASKCTLLYHEIKTSKVVKDQVHFYIQELKELKIKRDLTQTFGKSIDELDIKSGSEILDRLEERVKIIKEQTKTIPTYRRLINNTCEKRKLHYLEGKADPDKFKGIPFGLKQLDDLTGGIYPGELSIVFARTGHGKSRFLFNVAYNQVKMGYKVVYVTIEMSLDQLERMFDSRDSLISYTGIKSFQLDAEKEEQYFKKLEEQKNRKDQLILVDIPRGCSVPLIERELDQCEKMFGKPDVIVVDYLFLMETTTKYSQSWEKYGIISKELKELSRIRNVGVLTANQASRASIGADQTGTEHVSLSDMITWNADLLLHLSQTDEDLMKGILRLNVVKYRDGANIKMDLFTDWDKNYIWDGAGLLK